MGKVWLVIMILASTLAGGAWSRSLTVAPSDLPALPEIDPSKFPRPIRDQVATAYADAVAHPQDAAANGALGMLIQASNKSDIKAEICFQRAHVLDPTSFRWTYYLGALQGARGKYKEATETLRGALRLDSRYLPAQLKLGEFLLASGNTSESRKLHEQIIVQFSDSAQAYYDLGRARQADGDPDGAIEAYRKASDLYPDFGSAHYALALAYSRKGKADLAKAEMALYEKNKYDIPGVNDPLLAALTALYINPESLIQSGNEYAKQGKLEQAVAEDEKALRIDPEFFKAHMNLISFYGRLHDFDKAEEHYRAAVRIDPINTESYYNHGLLLMQQGKYPGAEEAFRKTLELDPAHPAALTSLGFLLERKGKQQEAIDAYHRALLSKPDYRQAHFNLGRILVNQQKYTEGIEQLLATLTPVDENTSRYLYALGAAYGRAGDRQNALRYLREAQAQASAQGQTDLLAEIERDIQTVESELSHP